MKNPIQTTQVDYLKRVVKRELSRRDFWLYCKALAPEFYTEDRHHLKRLCITLQALYEGRIAKKDINDQAEDWKIFEDIADIPEGWFICKKLMINMPPQHGKTRTLIMFTAWCLGRNREEKIITASYSDGTATDFSKYTRDLISEQKTEEHHIVYSDIFPKSKIKYGTATFKKWALEGNHFNYLGTGIGGSVTGKGATILIGDDLVKGAEEALNADHLEKLWLWYVGTFKSRVSAKDGEPFEIMNMTRWSLSDPCGKILEGKAKSEWFVIKYEAYNEKTGEMLCPSLLSFKRYQELKDLAAEDKVLGQIFSSNYHQEPFEAKGLLFENLNYYEPKDVEKEKFESSLGYGDIADEGDDSLSMPVGRNIGPKIYITDVVFTKDNTDITLPLCAKVLIEQLVNYVRIESNNQGSIFRKELQKLVPKIACLGVNNTAQKHTRIIMYAWLIKKYCYFLKPEYQSAQYKAFMRELTKYKKEEADNKHDDAPDSLSGLVKFILGILPHHYQAEPKIAA